MCRYRFRASIAIYMVQLTKEERFDFLSTGPGAGEYKKKDDAYRVELETEFEKIQHSSFGNDHLPSD